MVAEKVLLISMPDAALSFDRVVKLPNLGLCSIAGNLDGFRTYVLDLVLCNRRCASVLKDIVLGISPLIVGISAMSFQYHSAIKACKIIKSLLPSAKVVLGGYHSTLASDEIIRDGKSPFDFIVRSEGEETFRLLCKAIVNNSGFDMVPGIYYRNGREYIETTSASLADLSKLKLPQRNTRIFSGYHILGKRCDCIETSRGCLMGCSFCSIHGMYGRSFREYSLERVMEDIRLAHKGGAESIFIVDDNITMNVKRFKSFLLKIIEGGLNKIDYIVQASVTGMAMDKDLPRIMKEAGIKIVFLGIENNDTGNLTVLKKSHKAKMAQEVVNILKKNSIITFGGFIVANPEDTRESIRSTFRYIKLLKIDHAIVQCLTPYPGTEIRKYLIDFGLVYNIDNFSDYNGFTCNVHTKYLSRSQINRVLFIEYLRYYFNPRYRCSSRFLISYRKMIPRLIMNDFSAIAGILRGRIFPSRHRWV